MRKIAQFFQPRKRQDAEEPESPPQKRVKQPTDDDSDAWSNAAGTLASGVKSEREDTLSSFAEDSKMEVEIEARGRREPGRETSSSTFIPETPQPELEYDRTERLGAPYPRDVKVEDSRWSLRDPAEHASVNSSATRLNSELSGSTIDPRTPGVQMDAPENSSDATARRSSTFLDQRQTSVKPLFVPSITTTLSQASTPQFNVDVKPKIDPDFSSTISSNSSSTPQKMEMDEEKKAIKIEIKREEEVSLRARAVRERAISPSPGFPELIPDNFGDGYGLSPAPVVAVPPLRRGRRNGDSSDEEEAREREEMEQREMEERELEKEREKELELEQQELEQEREQDYGGGGSEDEERRRDREASVLSEGRTPTPVIRKPSGSSPKVPLFREEPRSEDEDSETSNEDGGEEGDVDWDEEDEEAEGRVIPPKKQEQRPISKPRAFITSGGPSRKERKKKADKKTANATSSAPQDAHQVLNAHFIPAKHHLHQVVAASTRHLPSQHRVMEPPPPPPLPPPKPAVVDYATSFLDDLFSQGLPPPARKKSFAAPLTALELSELQGRESGSDEDEIESEPPPPPPKKPPPQDFITAAEKFMRDGVSPLVPGLNLTRVLTKEDTDRMPSIYDYTTYKSDVNLLRTISDPGPDLLILPEGLADLEVEPGPRISAGSYSNDPPPPRKLFDLVPGRTRSAISAERELQILCSDIKLDEPKCVTGYVGDDRIRREYERGEGLEREKLERVLKELFYVKEWEVEALLDDIFEKHPLWFEYLYHLARIRQASVDLAISSFTDDLRWAYNAQKDEIEEDERVWKQDKMRLDILLEEQWAKPQNAPTDEEKQENQDVGVEIKKRMWELEERLLVPLKRLEARAKAEREGGKLIWDDDHIPQRWW
ncbi:hypothetical protein P7C70_g7298, partial [Phenoliferia sp. Uapishka_3]